MTIHELDQTQHDLTNTKAQLAAIMSAVNQSIELHDTLVNASGLNVTHVISSTIKQLDDYIGVIDKFKKNTHIDFPGV